jgi:hypothetical protein
MNEQASPVAAFQPVADALAGILVVKAGSKGKEPFRRPLRKRLKLSRLRRISSEHRSLHFYLTLARSLAPLGHLQNQ